jgi:hypothetical protein
MGCFTFFLDKRDSSRIPTHPINSKSSEEIMTGEGRSFDGGARVAIQTVVESSSRGCNISGQVR